MADRDWMLEVIMTLTDGNHDFFKKDFRPPTVRHQIMQMPVDESDGFFEGLPVSTSNARRNNYVALKPEEK